MSLRRRFAARFIAVFAAIIAGGASAVLPAAPAAAAGVYIANYIDSRCIHALATSGAVVDAGGTCGPFWVFELRAQDPGGVNIYRIRMDGTNLCVVVRGPSNDARAVLSGCGHWIDQHWARRGFSLGYQLINQNSGKCLTSRNGSASVDTVIQYTCRTDGSWEDQLWYHF
ncbi:RICIN domain-containing protein [Allorhizocola rhizosphaerae]|uniref:RICIN domain-containing protein n=1 Tax=Allorhizocola rhizosphaerae TaxID=1872709 RepID=UPI000E3CAF28|nr:RICIN domain-containing protein [Allorhizocola rhizosphaerae]